MKEKRFIERLGFSAIVLALASLPAFANLSLQNGDFSAGLNNWVVEWGDVTDSGGYALFQEDPTSISSTLSQEFTVLALALELPFDVAMSAVPGVLYDPFAWPDAFTASLYDNPIDLNPLVSNPAGVDEFFYLDNTGISDTVGTFDGSRITLDVSSFRDKDAYLVFDLWGSDDGMLTNVSLDNVSISVVPAPGALLLSVIGVGAVGF